MLKIPLNGLVGMLVGIKMLSLAIAELVFWSGDYLVGH